MDATDIADEVQDTTLAVGSEPQGEEPVPEKMLTASQVNALVQKAKRKGEQKMQEQLDAARQEIEQLKAQQPQQQAAQPSIDVIQLQKQIVEELRAEMAEKERVRQQEQLQQEVEQVAQQYHGKMQQGRDLYDDFEEVTADFNPAEFPQLVFLANQMDNTAQVIYDLQKNPAKLAQMLTWIDKSPSIARRELGKLSQSIKDNETAKRNLQEAQDPLSRLKPTSEGTDSGKANSVRDFKNASFLRV